jgi:1-acyl-sn-glycerol-3-phosphate acyltransferase
LGIAPEGTRRKVKAWKKGFYYIALNAKVPILLVFLDYRRKVTGIGPLITPSGDIEADMEIIRGFFANVTPRHPERATIPVVETKPGKNSASTEDP